MNLILILSLLGIAITLYISIAHFMKKKVICPVNSKSCNIVLDSKYSRTLGIKNELIGLIYYIIIFYSTFISIPNSFLVIASSLAAIYSIILLSIQIRILKNYCSWCITTAVINVFLSALIITL